MTIRNFSQLERHLALTGVGQRRLTTADTGHARRFIDLAVALPRVRREFSVPSAIWVSRAGHLAAPTMTGPAAIGIPIHAKTVTELQLVAALAHVLVRDPRVSRRFLDAYVYLVGDLFGFDANSPATELYNWIRI